MSFPGFARTARAFEAADLNHPTLFINRAEYNQFPEFVDVVKPMVLDYYHYHWWPKNHPERVDAGTVRTEWPLGQACRFDDLELLADLPALEVRCHLRVFFLAEQALISRLQRLIVATQFRQVGLSARGRFDAFLIALRLLTQPIIRYEPTSGSTKDGTIFAFTHDVLGTDPDALLVIEARQFEHDLRWEYAFARSHFTELTGYHREVEVWKVENDWPETKQHVFGDGPGRDKVYYSVERRP